MIDYIKGLLTELNPTVAVLETAGVGYEINIALPAFSALQDEENKEVRLFVSEIIREDAHHLFGFLTKGERQLFLMLLTVSGIGANTARMIMSAYTAGEIRQLVATGNAKALSKVKGIGSKTAQRIIVDLKDKVLKIDLQDAAQSGDTQLTDTGNAVRPQPVNNALKTEALGALAVLGFDNAAADKAVDRILQDTPDAKVEQIIRLALKML